jgi:hypothetical protein
MRPAGRAPMAMVVARHGTGVVKRPGRGFSIGELHGAGLSPQLASGWGVMVDVRRRSVIQDNVNSLMGWGHRPGPAKRTSGRAKEVEKEIGKVGRVVEKEAIKVEKEVVKVQKEDKEEAVKAEKTVRRRAPRPKARPKKKPQP